MLRDGGAEPIVPEKPAATVVVVRESPSGIEIFCVERHRKSGFLGGAVVFPGGQVDPVDSDPAWLDFSTPLGDRFADFADEHPSPLAFAVAALRETFEEAAILPVAGRALPSAEAIALRSAMIASTPFSDLVRRDGYRIDTGLLEPLGRWITPPSESKRFDTRFYLLPCPDEQSGKHDERETTQSFWATPSDILSRWEAGEILLAPPTSFTIELFVGERSIEGARRTARSQPLRPICPHFTNDGDEVVLALPGDPLYPDPRATAADGLPTRFVLSGRRFVTVRNPTAHTPSR